MLQKLRKADSELHAQQKKLGVEGRKQYYQLASNPFIRDRMNARALRDRIFQRLVARKFERDRLERSFRRQKNSENLHFQCLYYIKSN